MIRRLKGSAKWQGVFAAAVFCWFIIELANIILPVRANVLIGLYFLLIQLYGLKAAFLAIIALLSVAVIYLSRKVFFRQWETCLCLIFAFWLIVTRIVHDRTIPWADRFIILDYFILFLMFVAGIRLNEKLRERLLCAVGISYGIFFTIACAAGLFVIITNTALCVSPKNDIWIRGTVEAGLTHLELFSTHRNLNAPRVYMAIMLLLYVLTKSRKNGVKVIFILCVVLMHIAFATFHSRTSLIALALSYGMYANISFRKLFGRMTSFARIPLISLITAAVIMIGYCSYGWSNTIVSDFRDYCAPRFAAWYNTHEYKPDSEFFVLNGNAAVHSEKPAALISNNKPVHPEIETLSLIKTEISAVEVTSIRREIDDAGIDVKTDDSTGELTDKRDILSNRTLSERTYIWKAGFSAIKRDPSIALFGTLKEQLMIPVNSILAEEGIESKEHMHNGFMQLLMLTGIPGLLPVLIWTIIIIIKMMKVWFKKPGEVQIEAKMYVVPLAGIFIYELMEVHVFSDSDIFAKVFYLIAGIFLAYYRELSGAKMSGNEG